jgi:hypothetical protein
MNKLEMARALEAILPSLNDYELHMLYKTLKEDEVPMTKTNKWVLVNLNMCTDDTICKLFNLVFQNQ